MLRAKFLNTALGAGAALSVMSESSSPSAGAASVTEYADRVHECLKFVPVYEEGAFSCSSLDDDDSDDDDEVVKRILAEHCESEPTDDGPEGFSSVYVAAATMTAKTDLSHGTRDSRAGSSSG